MDEDQSSGFATLLASLSSDALTRGKQFERLVKWWLTQDPIWSRKIKNVWLWDEWPEYPGRDIGIDLIAEMTDGTLCAVQAKCFDENRDIPKSELDSFISAASHRTFQHRLLVATTDGLSANAKRMLTDQHVVRVMRSDLESSLDIWPASIEELSAPAQPHASPRPHQNLAITDVTNGFEGNSRGQLIMACGTGKTLTALWIKETLTPKTTLVLVPSLNLLAQTLSEWAKNSLSPWQYLCVCSDDTVNKLDDQPISTVGDLPFEVTTNPADIAKFLSLGGERIIFSTYQSSAQVAKAQEQSGVSFDLVICDEAHRLTGKTDADYATVLDEKKIVGQKRLFMTATPRTYTTAAKTKAEDRGVEITSMDDEHVYGPVLHKLSFGEAIKQDLLSDYRVLIVGVTDPQVQDLIDRRELVSVNDSVNTDARTLAAHIGLAKATKDYNLKRTISFHSRIKSADQFAKDHLKILDWLPKSHKPSGNTWTGTISGAMNTGDRRRLIKQLSLDGEDRHALLTNARCLTEGVDVPSLDGVAFIDPRSSQIDIIQAVGRAIRKSKNKEIGTIILPVLIPTDSDAETALEDTAFKPIWAILNALKSHDDEFAVELNNLRTELGRTGSPGNLPNRLVEDLPVDIDSLLPGFSYKLSVAILEHSTASWEFSFGLLLEYFQQTGSSRVPVEHMIRGFSLGKWASSQRASYNLGQLRLERVQQLEALPNWTWDPISDQWQEMYSLLLTHIEGGGTSRLPPTFSLPNGERLGLWVSVQRRPNVGSTKSDERRKLLEAIPDWTWDPFDTEWEETYAAMVAFSERTGTSRTPRGHKESGFGIDSWATNQRRSFKDGTLGAERLERLSKLPDWSWDPLNDDWDFCFKALQEYVKLNPKSPIPPKDMKLDNGVLLYSWIHNQKNRHKLRKIMPTRVAMLETIPGWSWSGMQFEGGWDMGFEALKTYFTSVLTDIKLEQVTYGTGASLSEWIQTQRGQYRLGNLSIDRIERLNGLPDWSWGVRDALLEQGVTQLETFMKAFGHLDVPHPYITPDAFRLGAWVSQKRVRYKKGKLSEGTISALEELPGWAWQAGIRRSGLSQRLIDFHADNWNNKYEIAKRFSEQFGHCSFQKTLFEGQDLAHWGSNQRKAFRDAKLSQEKIEALEELKGWSWKPKGGPRKSSY